MKQQIKINGIWAVLPSNFKVTVKRTNPLFNNEGDFSFPFQLDLSVNRAIIQSAADPHGRFALRMLNGLDFEYWYDGQLLFRGLTEVSDSVQFKDSITINFNAAVKSFTERIEGLNARDVSVEHMQLGYACTGMRFSSDGKYVIETQELNKKVLHNGAEKKVGPVDYRRPLQLPYDTGYVSAPVKNALYTSVFNVSEDCRTKPFCNTRLALDVSNENAYRILDYNRRDAAPCMFVLYWLKRLFLDLDIAVIDEYTWQGGDIGVEDMNRLAFFSVFPRYNTEDWESAPAGATMHKDAFTGIESYYKIWSGWSGILPQYSLGEPFFMCTSLYVNNMCVYNSGLDYATQQTVVRGEWIDPMRQEAYNSYVLDDEGEYGFRPAFLSSEQYPNVEATDIINDLHDIFGLRIIYDAVTNTARVCYVRDILHAAMTTAPKGLNAEFHSSPIVTRSVNNGVVVTYGKEMDESSTAAAEAAYDYDMPVNIKDEYGHDTKDDSGNLITDTSKVVTQSASDTLSMVPSSTDRRTFYDSSTGNAYRIMVSEDSEENNQGATPIEVGQYNSVRVNVSDVDKATTYTCKFSPVECNDVYHSQNGVYSYSQSDLAPFVDAQQTNYQTDDIFDESDDVEVNCMKETFQVYTVEAIKNEGQYTNYFTDSDVDFFQKWGKFLLHDNQSTGRWVPYKTCLVPNNHNSAFADDQPVIQFGLLIRYATNNGESCDMTSDDSPLQQWQDEDNYVLGFMRGPGNAAGIEYSSQSFNNDGTRDWYNVVGTPTFTADSIDQFGNVFDYNGTAEGGVDQSGRLSLRLDARKVYGYDSEGNPKFYPITNLDFARRGVVSKMLEDYLHLEANKKTITHYASVPIGTLMNIDWCSYYDLQQCVGFINSVQFDISENGVGESTIEQYVLD